MKKSNSYTDIYSTKRFFRSQFGYKFLVCDCMQLFVGYFVFTKLILAKYLGILNDKSCDDDNIGMIDLKLEFFQIKKQFKSFRNSIFSYLVDLVYHFNNKKYPNARGYIA
ncbi:hypothetical protein BpHYR1_048684 [Brachionus plicatilis]|uniref:Uncharacterized protein n=1 Tax=Brachionus plicatilis TaxID=10195 RepID=A0A3M7S4N2_BRAPC|nr:hypothetical protein BpHYR1_048684 [Brachionus plicatilis]